MAVILILLGIVLVIFSSYSIIKEADDSSKNDFSMVFKDRQGNVNETDVTLGEMRREFAETIMELQIDILELKEKLGAESGEVKPLDNDITEKLEENIHNNEEKLTFNGVKINNLDKLLKEGYTLDEISEKLEISKGEILLIKDLYLK